MCARAQFSTWTLHCFSPIGPLKVLPLNEQTWLSGCLALKCVVTTPIPSQHSQPQRINNIRLLEPKTLVFMV